jgi:hypothetical protein
MMRLSILSGVVAFLSWCATDTSLKRGDLRNSEGKLTFWSTLSTVLVQIVLWATVGLFAAWVVPHLPQFLLTAWRLPFTIFASVFWQWFALLMILQCAWLLLRASGQTALHALHGGFRERDDIRKPQQIRDYGDSEKSEGPV